MENKPEFRPNPDLKIVEQVLEIMGYNHYSYRAESTYSNESSDIATFTVARPTLKSLMQSILKIFITSCQQRQCFRSLAS